MTTSATAAYAGTYFKTWNVVADADADTSLTFTHGFAPGGTATAPVDVSLVPLLPVAYSSQWVLSSVNASQIILGKTSAGSSGTSAAQLRVRAALPHSIVS